MVKKEQDKKEIAFEEALSRLESIVKDMEDDETSLDDSLKKYEEGIKLVRLCAKKLETAEKKIEVVVQEGKDSLKKIPFSMDENESDNV